MPGCRFRPPMPLASLVECLWYWEGAPTPHRQERLLPNAEAAIIFNLRDDPIVIYDDGGRAAHLGKIAFSGARSNCFIIDCEQQERVIGVQFRPGGAFPFFPMPISAMEDGSFALADLWGAEAALVRERILAAVQPHAMLRTLARCLLERMHARRVLDPAVLYAARQLGTAHASFGMDGIGGVTGVAGVTRQIGLSQRRFRQLFHEQVGVAPKTFHRVRRFQHTLTYLRSAARVRWAEVAAACGYYDQAHLCHEFAQLAGMSPAVYLATATPHLNHVPVVE